MSAKENELLLKKLAAQFRAAIESCPKDLLPIRFARFPFGSCGDTCLLLSKWLEEKGQSGFVYVEGIRGKGSNVQSHAWLERDGIVVDITGDQFGPDQPSVYVGPRSPLHNAFRILNEHHSDLERYDSQTALMLSNAYRVLQKKLYGGK
jgi:hypothetical protein